MVEEDFSVADAGSQRAHSVEAAGSKIDYDLLRMRCDTIGRILAGLANQISGGKDTDTLSAPMRLWVVRSLRNYSEQLLAPVPADDDPDVLAIADWLERTWSAPATGSVPMKGEATAGATSDPTPSQSNT